MVLRAQTRWGTSRVRNLSSGQTPTTFAVSFSLLFLPYPRIKRLLLFPFCCCSCLILVSKLRLSCSCYCFLSISHQTTNFGQINVLRVLLLLCLHIKQRLSVKLTTFVFFVVVKFAPLSSDQANDFFHCVGLFVLRLPPSLNVKLPACCCCIWLLFLLYHVVGFSRGRHLS
jgi:hypothetical protein